MLFLIGWRNNRYRPKDSFASTNENFNIISYFGYLELDDEHSMVELKGKKKEKNC